MNEKIRPTHLEQCARLSMFGSRAWGKSVNILRVSIDSMAWQSEPSLWAFNM